MTPQGQPSNPQVYAGGMDGAACYRIPTIVRTPVGTLLAFAEQRLASCGDNGSNNIVLRRSGDEGLTWGPIQVLALGSASGVPFSNPNPVVVQLPEGFRHPTRHGAAAAAEATARSPAGGEEWAVLLQKPSIEQSAVASACRRVERAST